MAPKQVKAIQTKNARSLDKKKQEETQDKRAQIRVKQEEWKKKQQQRRATVTTKSVTAKAKLDEAMEQRVKSLQSTFDDLQDDMMLTNVHSSMGDVESVLTTLPADLAQLRGRGYNFRSYLENKVNVLTDKWETICDQVEDDIDRHTSNLMEDADKVAASVQQAQVGSSSLVGSAESAVQSFKRKCESAHSTIQGRYGDVGQTIQQTRQQIDQVKWAFDQADEAKFDLLPSEFLVAACKAKLLEKPDGDEGQEGNLYLTDERLIFERKESVATKKFLFITTESETVQELKFAPLIGHVADAKAQDKQHFFSSTELLFVQFSPEAGVGSAVLALQDGATNEEWCQLINRVRTGEIDKERVEGAAEVKEAAAVKVASAPTICPTCGGTLPTTIARGQSTINCDYCGAVIRL
ncbi:MAG: hypothetical protein H0T73_15345 [Ardenticatenales bacterium]|nr:hypothetical protein [Ardenticatenales bacterium]